ARAQSSGSYSHCRSQLLSISLCLMVWVLTVRTVHCCVLSGLYMCFADVHCLNAILTHSLLINGTKLSGTTTSTHTPRNVLTVHCCVMSGLYMCFAAVHCLNAIRTHSLLRNGTKIAGTQWSPNTLRNWLFDNCWTMGYESYDVPHQRALNARIEHALKMHSEW